MSSSLHETRLQIEALYREGRLKEVCKIIDELQQDGEISPEDNLALDNFKLKVLIRRKKNDEALELADIIIKLSKDLNKPLESIDALISKARVLIELRDTEKGRGLLRQAGKIISKLSDVDDRLKFHKIARLQESEGLSFLAENFYDRALDCFENFLEVSRETEDLYCIATAIYSCGFALFYLGDLEKANRFFDESIELFREIDAKYFISQVYSMKSGIHFNKGELNQALEFNSRSLVLFEELDNEFDIARTIQHMGMIYGQSGNLDKALQQYEKSREIFEDIELHHMVAKCINEISGIQRQQGHYDQALESLNEYYNLKVGLKDERSIGIALNRIGEIFLIKGELNEASKHFEDALAINKKFGVKRILSLVYSNLGELNYKQGNLEDAIKYHLQSLAVHEELDLTFRIADSLQRLIVIHLDAELFNLAKEFLEKFKQMAEKSESKIVTQAYQLSESLYLKESAKERDRNKAELLLERLIQGDIVDYRIKIEALLNLCDLLLWNIRKAEDVDLEEEILDELQEYVSMLTETAKKQNSYSLTAESLFLQSQLALLELDTQKAQNFLKQALVIAKENGLDILSIKISNEYDTLLEQLESWEDFTMKLPTIAEKLELTHIEEKLEQIIKRRTVAITDKEIGKEFPILFLILSSEGTVVFSEQFEEALSPQFIEEVLKNIREFTSEEKVIETIERFKLQDYICLLKNFEGLLFCYVFIGKSYSGDQKLEKFTKILSKKTLITSILEESVDSQKSLEYEDRLKITEILDGVFLKE
ncbi:MAG: tetratricopeptide repeat protein [Candidatus Heimdallarchaeota archaeon]|nr:tetratricopeptide repeat protein [Candidatus Heimdallarchaeota archaeon]MCK4770586.1 tetratricopeptide repeat protein [Candidatus Heimdallarchaeota archaeon]